MTVNIYGIHPLQALLSRNQPLIRKIMVQKGSANARITQILHQVEHEIPVEFVATETLTKFAESEHHQGIVAVCDAPPTYSLPYLKDYLGQTSSAHRLIMVLDGVQDPRNFGACIRTADAAGVDLMLSSKHHSSGITQVVYKTSAGAALWLPIVIVPNLANTMRMLKEHQFWIMGASLDSKRSLYDIDFNSDIVLTLGSEGQGMADLTQKTCDELFHIPMRGAVESLNVSVAAGICLYEVMRQRLKIPK